MRNDKPLIDRLRSASQLCGDYVSRYVADDIDEAIELIERLMPMTLAEAVDILNEHEVESVKWAVGENGKSVIGLKYGVLTGPKFLTLHADEALRIAKAIKGVVEKLMRKMEPKNA